VEDVQEALRQVSGREVKAILEKHSESPCVARLQPLRKRHEVRRRNRERDLGHWFHMNSNSVEKFTQIISIFVTLGVIFRVFLADKLRL
jgi:hypothetical protein